MMISVSIVSCSDLALMHSVLSRNNNQLIGHPAVSVLVERSV
jgi:hypothetical protein